MPYIYPDATSDFFNYGYDLDKAKALLAEAGFKDGFKTTLSYNAGDPTQEPIALLLPVLAARDRRRSHAREAAGRRVLRERHQAREADDLLSRLPVDARTPATRPSSTSTPSAT